MNTPSLSGFSFHHATLDTLADLYALHTDTGEVERLQARLRERVLAGHVDLSKSLLLRSARGIEAAVMLADNPHVPVFPRYRADIPSEALTHFFERVRELVSTTPDRQLVLDDTLALPRAAEANAAGWVLADSNAVYTTDLAANASRYAPDAAVREVEIGDPAIQDLRAALGRPDWTLGEGWHLYALFDAEKAVALAALGAGGRPGGPPEASIDLIGVHPNARRRGFGRRLHAHVMHWAAQKYARHTGGTEIDNHAMRRIFEAHGGELQFTQLYFRQG